MQPTSTIEAVHVDHGVLSEMQMGISTDAKDVAMVIQAATNLYSDLILAFVREISTNAIDSHIEAGQTRPIEVTLPTVSDLNFTVQDWGVGMSKEDIEVVFSQFGRSTKRDSDKVAGMLGFGCKSPLTYTLSFTLDTVKDGERTVALVTKGEDGVGAIKFLAHESTSRPNGVKVKIPIERHDVDRCRRTAERFFRFWRDGVLVDGEKPDVIQASLELDPDVIIPQGSYGREDSYVVMGNVPYPYNTPNGCPATVTWVPMGSVEFTPSREQLKFTDLTNDTLATIKEFVKDRLDRQIEERLESCDTTYEMLKVANEIHRSLPLQSYRHKKLNKYWGSLPVGSQEYPAWRVNHVNEARKEHHLQQVHFTTNTDGSPSHRFVVGFPWKQLSMTHRQRIDMAGLKKPYVVLPAKAGFSTDGFPGIHWKDVPELPKKERVRKNEGKTKYLFFQYDGNLKRYEQYDGDLKVVYTTEEFLAIRASSHGVAAAHIRQNQVDKFRRLHPDAVRVEEWVDEEVKKLCKHIRKNDIKWMEAHPVIRDIAPELRDRLGEIKDKELRDLLNISPSEHLEELLKLRHSFHNIPVPERLRGAWTTFNRPSYMRSNELDKFNQKYPLLQWRDLYLHFDEWVLYLNAKHKQTLTTNTTNS